ncbi:MAG: HD-GYP domain-containing protein [Hydrogenophaga sp.]|uniref:HD-GYP domain-containing protein n=1 Tax=Hydrogenophaga sp. TaxID=1904254 RepID=UPI003D0D1AC0
MYKPLPLDVIALNQPVPVNVWDPKGVLLLRKGEPITSEQHRGHLMLHAPMVRESDWQAWSYSYTAELDRLVRSNESLSRIAGLTHMVEVRTLAAQDEGRAHEVWPDVHAALATLLHQGADAGQFVGRIERLAARAERLWRDSPDESLLVLVQLLFDVRVGYSTTHALLSAGLCALLSPAAGLPPDAQTSLFRAAMCMNIGMTRTHDAMARQGSALSDAQRLAVREHPVLGAMTLRRLGVSDAVWLQLVEEHHERPDGTGYPAGKPVTGVAQRLLQMSDGYVARLSPRQGRGGLLSQQVARELYMGPDRQPDSLGALFIKHIGLYPPGSCVRLASGELGVVAKRGSRAHAPLVFALVGRQGLPLGEPALRDTQDPLHEVRESLPPGEMKVVVNVSKLLSRL